MLRKAFNQKIVMSNNEVTLSPNVGEAFRVTDFYCVTSATINEFLTIQIDRMTVGYAMNHNTDTSHVPFPILKEQNDTIFKQLKDAGLNMSYPVPEGSSLVISTPSAWSVMIITYEIWDAVDVKPTDLNGSLSKEYLFLQYGTYDTAITAAGTYTLNSVFNPVEFPNFPFGDPVPSKTKMEILGIGCPAILMSGAAFATDWISSTYLRLYKEREVLFDEDRNGLYVFADVAISGNNTTLYYDEKNSVCAYGGKGSYKPIFILPVPLTFEAGEELTIQMSFVKAASGATLIANKIICCLPIRVTRL